MSSSARAVCLGRPPGIFLLMKWMTCSFSGAGPSVAGGAEVCLRATRRKRSLARRCALKPMPTMPTRIALMVWGLVALRKQHRDRVAGPEALLPHLAQQVAHVHRDVAEVDLHRAWREALVAHRAVVGHVLELFPMLDADAAARLLFVQKSLDQERGREDLVARAVEQVGARHVRRAHRLALAATQAVLHRVGDGADVALLHDQRLVAHEPEAGGVGVGQVGVQHIAPRSH